MICKVKWKIKQSPSIVNFWASKLEVGWGSATKFPFSTSDLPLAPTQIPWHTKEED